MDKTTYKFEATGTQWEMSQWYDDEHALVSRQDVENYIARFEKVFSRFREDSRASRLSGVTGTFDAGSIVALLKIYEKFHEATDGLFTPFIGKTLADAGYDAEYSFVPRDGDEKDDAIDFNFIDAIEFLEGDHIRIKKPVHFDFGGAGKGYAIDLLSKYTAQKGCKKFLINAGGDLYYRSMDDNEITVALEDPRDHKKAIGTIKFANKSLCASGAAKRQWTPDRHHIINPHTGESAKEVIATWALSDFAVVADGCATSLFFIPPKKLVETFDFEYVIMYADGSVKYSDFFKGKLFLPESKRQ